ncbi:uncharacterized protein I206_106004 [Kwoniella pini CBS 10737]|uniref:ABC transporter domain-containing protein n=1 Tax=Kwoniella pini CBS 10737 TaxID=1296096 RepID=A0A1B9I0S6_9TREE|nr:uncharacterized protein I206_04827 [Kwoniella pini CBS 10737]OCF49139.1 hypothetical protein I206_04827 [Kwoniella pini CBS 10737]
MSKSLPLVRFPPNALIHRLGSPNTSISTALLRFPEQGWTINKDNKEGWAIVGDSEGRKLAIDTLLSRHRIHPLTPPPGPFPYLSNLPSSIKGELSTYKPIRHLAFSRPTPTGEFTDFTARYGALLEEDKLTFLENLLKTLNYSIEEKEIKKVMKLMGIENLLNLPNISLSSGQIRKSRIALSLLTKPLLLILEDPMSGLDFKSRKEVSKILGNLNNNSNNNNNNNNNEPRIILVIRDKNLNNLPDWITNVVEIKSGKVWIGSKNEFLSSYSTLENGNENTKIEEVNFRKGEEEGKEVVKLDKVSVSYGEGSRPVLNEISWTIREGEKWHLVGANGSGKTTLLSLILGHHPRSYSIPSESLTLFNKARREISTVELKSMIGHTSPEIFIAFPRNMGLSAYQTIGSGFKGIFTRSQLNENQKERILNLLNQVKDLLQPTTNLKVNKEEEEGMKLKEIALKEFSHFTHSQQNLLLFLRSIIGKPNLLILDEPSQGVDEIIWERCKLILKNEWKNNPKMSTIVVSHYQDEVPWREGQGRVLKLDKGRATME